MEQQLKEIETSPNKLSFQIAASFAVYTIALIFLFKVLGVEAQEENVSMATKVISSVLSYVPYILAIMYAQSRDRDALGGFITFGRAFSTGFRVSATAGMFIGLLMILYYKVLDPGALQHILDIAIEKAGDNDKAIRSVKSMGSYMPILIGFTAAITFTVYGLVISLVGAAIFKKVPASVE